MQSKWREVYGKLSELLDEQITLLVQSPSNLQIEYTELKKDENQKVFKKDGSLKKNNKNAKLIEAGYREIIREVGLKDYESWGHLNFAYGVMRFHGESLKSFKTNELEVYYEADFDLVERSKGLVEPITEIEYQEKYLEELKKNKTE